MQLMHALRRPAIIVGLVGALLVVPLAIGHAASQDQDIVSGIRAELIPEEGTETAYGIPLTLDLLPLFVDWWYTLVPQVESDPRYFDALSSLVAPCCDDNTAFKCCCEQDGNACNIIRSGKGLAAYLILEFNDDTETISETVLQWFRFARPDYYIAAEMASRGLDPEPFGLTTYGSCYRGMCSTPISEGGCGGMQELIEPALESAAG